jgi:hypothetical protein
MKCSVLLLYGNFWSVREGRKATEMTSLTEEAVTAYLQISWNTAANSIQDLVMQHYVGPLLAQLCTVLPCNLISTVSV